MTGSRFRGAIALVLVLAVTGCSAARRPERFHTGYKLFYDEGVNIYQPSEVLAMRPAPEYVSYQ